MRLFPAADGLIQGQAVYSEIMEELCAEEGQSLVAETMAPLHDQLVELQRAKDVAAMQVCDHEQCILVSLGLLVPTSTTSGLFPTSKRNHHCVRVRTKNRSKRRAG